MASYVLFKCIFLKGICVKYHIWIYIRLGLMSHVMSLMLTSWSGYQGLFALYCIKRRACIRFSSFFLIKAFTGAISICLFNTRVWWWKGVGFKAAGKTEDEIILGNPAWGISDCSAHAQSCTSAESQYRFGLELDNLSWCAAGELVSVWASVSDGRDHIEQQQHDSNITR